MTNPLSYTLRPPPALLCLSPVDPPPVATSSTDLIYSQTMRLLSHNYMKSSMKNVPDDLSYPLRIDPTSLVLEPTPLDAVFLQSMLAKIDWSGFQSAVLNLSLSLPALFASSGLSVPLLPSSLPVKVEELSALELQGLHTLLMDVHVIEGALVCPATGRRFVITDGIPNMLLLEDEL